LPQPACSVDTIPSFSFRNETEILLHLISSLRICSYGNHFGGFAIFSLD